MGLFKIGWRDLVRGALLAVSTSVISVLVDMINSMSFDWKRVGVVAVSTLLTYLAHQFASDEQGKLGGKL